MAFTPPPTIPPRGARSVFSKAVDAFVRWMAALPAELDLFLANLSSLAAGGGYAIPYIYDGSGTNEIDPGPGKVRFNSSVHGQITAMYIDIMSSAGNNVSGLLDTFGASSSAVKGVIRFQKLNDPSRWMSFQLTAAFVQSSYRAYTLTPIGNFGTPFTNGDQLVVSFQRTGDKGDVGNAMKKVQVAPAPVNGVVTVDYNNGACLVWTPAAGTSTLKIDNWPAAGTLGEFWIIGTNMGDAGKTVNTNFPVNWLRPDGTYANNTSITTNHGTALRPTGEDNVLLWGRSGAPSNGKVAR